MTTDRYEFKYLVDLETAARIESIVKQHGFTDPHTPEGGSYTVNSTYFDTPDWLFYTQKLDGISHRKKIRLRTYNQSPEPAFFEIKYRDYSRVSKLRIKLSQGAAQSLMFERPAVEDMNQLPLDHQTIYNTVNHYDLRPTNLIQYERKAYAIEQDDPCRITFDANIRSSLPHRHETDSIISSELFPGHTVLEIKVSESLPLWCMEMLRTFGLSPRSISKYALGVERLMNNKGDNAHGFSKLF